METKYNLEELFGKDIVEDKVFAESFKLYDGIVNNIYYLLRKKGWKQKDLAKKLGKSESEISKWLDGFHNFKLETLAKIQLALEADILLTGKQIRHLIWNEQQSITTEDVFSSNFDVKWRISIKSLIPPIELAPWPSNEERIVLTPTYSDCFGYNKHEISLKLPSEAA